MIPLYGLIGYPLEHSFSAKYFAEKFAREGIEALYKNFPLEDIGILPTLPDKYPQLQGFNVTIPYKEKVFEFLSEVSPQAREIGAVNCVKIEEGKLKGYNTDVDGFRDSLLTLIGANRPRALVLGSGGASKAVRYVLTELGIEYRTVARTPKNGEIAYREVGGIIADHKLIVNTTPLGTFPDVDVAPQIPYERLTQSHYLFDLVYNPEETKFLRLGREQGAQTKNGWDMLVGQAEKAWEIWNE